VSRSAERGGGERPGLEAQKERKGKREKCGSVKGRVEQSGMDVPFGSPVFSRERSPLQKKRNEGKGCGY